MRYGKRCNRYSEDEDNGKMGNWRKTNTRERTVKRDYNKRERKTKIPPRSTPGQKLR